MEKNNKGIRNQIYAHFVSGSVTMTIYDGYSCRYFYSPVV